MIEWGGSGVLIYDDKKSGWRGRGEELMELMRS